MAYYNPYYQKNFLEFFQVLTLRLWNFISGNSSTEGLAADEVQLLVLLFVASSTALIGTFLVLRKMAMLANSLSHTILLGIVGAFYFLMPASEVELRESHATLNIQALLVASVITGFLTTFLTEFLTKVVRLQADASTGLVFTFLFALGIIFVTLLTRSAHIGIEAVMGNVDGLHVEDLKLVAWVWAFNMILITLFFKQYQITSFDQPLAKSLGISTWFFNYLLMLQVAATVVGAFRAVGVLMVLALITGPALTARFFVDRLEKMLLLSVLFGCTASVIGVALSRHLLTVYDLPLTTGGLVVCVITVFFVLALLFAPQKGLLTKYSKHFG